MQASHSFIQLIYLVPSFVTFFWPGHQDLMGKTSPTICLVWYGSDSSGGCGGIDAWTVYLLIYLLIMLLQLSHSYPLTPLHPAHPLPPTFPTYSLCPWVILINCSASTFPILFLPSPSLFSTYHLCYLFSVPIPPLSPSHSSVDNPSCDLHFCDSVPVLVVCLVCFCFCFRCGC